ncbi:MAG: hypothetical protein R2828_04095 [Saprospiraceae bacterium]
MITTGQPSSNPRLVKEADALTAKGFQVSVYYCHWAKWADINDEKLLKEKEWNAFRCGGHPNKNIVRWYFTRFRQKLARNLPGLIGVHRLFCRSYDELLFKVLRSNADFYIAHNLGALAVAGKAAQKQNKPFAFDAEDFHRGEVSLDSIESNLIKELEDKYLKYASYISAASPLIEMVYKKLYPGIQTITINNVFPLANQPRFLELSGISELRMFWFSQKISKVRGLPDVLKAMELLKEIPIHLTLLGNSSEEERIYINSSISSDKHKISIINPCSELELIKTSANHHIGLALERTEPYNRSICLTNKLFTYLLAGNAIIASDTPAQKKFLTANPEVGSFYSIGNITELANLIRKFHLDREHLSKIRRNAWLLAQDLYNWEKEQIKLLNLIRTIH